VRVCTECVWVCNECMCVYTLQKSCGGVVRTRRTLTNAPDVVSVGLVWDSERPTFEHIRDVFRTIETVLHPAEVSVRLLSPVSTTRVDGPS